MSDNIYYSPEKYGLEVVAEIEYSHGNYEYDTRVVWRQKETGKLFTARDSGCSCPTPFEDYNMTNISPFDFDELDREVKGELSKKYKDVSASDAQSFIEKIRTV